jgi:hypothetical protein
MEAEVFNGIWHQDNGKCYAALQPLSTSSVTDYENAYKQSVWQKYY